MRLYQTKVYIKTKESDPVPRQGGRRKVLYSLTAEGKRALKQAYEIQKLAWDGLDEMILKFD